jgi:hypothetical protein
MLVRNVTREQLDQALAKTNEEFGGNIAFDTFHPTNTKQTHWRVTLCTFDSKAKGSRVHIRYDFGGKQNTRRSRHACWHVHGTFMDALPPDTTITTAGRTKHPGDQWEDWNIGSMMFPVYFSESCGC